MTREERLYFHNDLQNIFDKWVAQLSPSEAERRQLQLASFEDKYMSAITDQQYLPQSVFRIFLDSITITGLLDEIAELAVPRVLQDFTPIENSYIDTLFA